MKNKTVGLLISGIMLISTLTGCSLSLSTGDTSSSDAELMQLRDMGIIAYEESTLGIPMDTENITEKLESGHYYVKHGDILYPCYTDIFTYEGIAEFEADPITRWDIFNSESVINIPTLFEGDELYYFNDSNVLMFSTFERFKDLGWSIGLRDLKTTPAGYVYLDLENEEAPNECILPTLSSMRDLSKTSLLVDKIGGVRLTDKLCKDGIINGLIEGVNYDLEIYDGTNYHYYNTTVNTRYFQSMEVYAIDTYTPLQDYLYKIDIPEYLPEGYYDIDALGMFRYVKSDRYSDSTDFNTRLLYQYEVHNEGDWSLSENKAPAVYSETESLNKFIAYDEGCFGWVDPALRWVEDEEETEEEAMEEMSAIGLANFLAASKTTKEIWLPKDRDITVSIESKESTGSISLVYDSGKTVKLPFDRIAESYSCNVKGSGEKVTLVVQGLYSDYVIRLTNAESYHGQTNETVTE